MSSFLRKASFVLLCAALAGPASAVEYSVRVIVDQTAFYDSNLPMFRDPTPESPTPPAVNARDKYVSAYELAPQLNLRARSQRWDFRLQTIVSFSRLSDQLYDSDDQLVNLEFSHANDVARWEFAASVDRDSTRSNVEELGSIFAASRTERYSFAPRWTRTLGPRDSVSVGGSWTQTDYDSTRFSDYEYYSADATWLRQLSEQNQLQVTVYNAIFDSGEKPLNLESDTIGLSVALNRSVNEALSTNFSIGAREVETTTRTFCDFISAFFGLCQFNSIIENDDSSTGLTAAAGVDYEAEAWNVAASVSRSLVPNGAQGELLETDSLRLNYTRRLQEGLAFDFVAELTSEEVVDSAAFERDRLRIEPRLRWRFAERWSLVSSLRYRLRDQNQLTAGGPASSDADGTMFSLRVRYEHPRAQWSR